MKHLLIILISILLLSSPVIGDNHKGEVLYKWETSSGKQWMGFGDKDTHPKYEGDVENGVPNGLGILYDLDGSKYVGSWKNGKKNGQGAFTQYSSLIYPDGRKYVGEYKNGKEWNGTYYDNYGKKEYKLVNGKIE